MRKAQGLPMTTIVLIIMVILVLVVVVIFFYTSMSKGGSQTQQQNYLAECQNKCLRAQAMATAHAFSSAANCKTYECGNSAYCSTLDCNFYMTCVVTYADSTQAKLICSGGACANCANP